MTASQFKVIIIGGGPIGLTAAHALTAVGIDWILLEKRSEIIQEPGAGVFLFPNTLRFFDQINILEKLKPAGNVATNKVNMLQDGTVTVEAAFDNLIREQYGYSSLSFDRLALTRALFEALPGYQDPTKILTSSKVIDILPNPNGVEAVLEDGTKIPGSIIVSCEGTWSRTRQLVEKLAKTAGRTPSPDAHPLHSRIKTLYGRVPFPIPKSLQLGAFFETHATHTATQAAYRNGGLGFAVYKLLPEHNSEHKVFSPADSEEYVKQFFDIKLLGKDGPRFEEVWQSCQKTVKEDGKVGRAWYQLIEQEEGLAPYSFHDRIVLAGDAVLKVNSLSGLGLNIGIQGIISLVNHLTLTLHTSANPSTHELTQAFANHAEDMAPLHRYVYKQSLQTIDVAHWNGWIPWFLDQYVVPLVGFKTIMNQTYSKNFIRHGKLLKGVESGHTKSGTLSWTN